MGFTYIQLNNFFQVVYTVRQRKAKKSSTNQIILYEKALGDAGKEKKKKKKNNNFSNMEKPLAETGPGSGNHLLQPGPFGG